MNISADSAGTSSGHIARYYKELRAAHLERAEALDDGQITYYSDLNYDLPENTLRNHRSVIRISARKLTGELKRRRIRVLEVNEPTMISAWPALVQIILRSRRLRRKGHLHLVTYAIGNVPVEEQVTAKFGFEDPFTRALSRFLARQITLRMSRIAFGTSAAEEMYTKLVPQCRGISRRFSALPAVGIGARTGAGGAKVARKLVFVGTFEQRKGIRDLMIAWPYTASALAGSSLTVIGKGPLQSEVEEWCRGQATVRLLTDPPRPVIMSELESSSVLVLLSQRDRGWREQIGLPILEALSFGCTIVTTDETGIADELVRAGHTVLPARSHVASVAKALVDALQDPIPPEIVRSALPAEDGRLTAHRWLMQATDGD